MADRMMTRFVRSSTASPMWQKLVPFTEDTFG